MDTYLNNSSPIQEREALQDLLRPEGAAALAWQSRVQHELMGRYAGRCVFRLRHRLKDLVAWLQTEEIPMETGDLSLSLGYHNEDAAPRAGEEGGRLCFRWKGEEFLAYALRIWGERRDETYSWIVAPSRASAEKLLQAFGGRGARGKSAVHVFTGGWWEEAPALGNDLAKYTWEHLVLPAEDLERLRKTTETFFAGENVYRDLGIPWKLGLLFMGPPGTGKTTATKVLANNCNVPFLTVRGFESGVSPDADDIHRIFQGARDRAPCVLCLEDVDGMITDGLRSVSSTSWTASTSSTGGS